ncbi:MAG: DUF4453 domain-containing protein [Neomegalonema sp.]|nr:DUF4453 domain-containing protein [Neomegalonema sp.]
MRVLFLMLAVFVAAPAAASELCDDWWHARNSVMDRAGYCFSSPLGKAMFDNSDCTGKKVKLDRASLKLVEKIMALEAAAGCKVDTSKTSLDLDDLRYRKLIDTPPVRDDTESACIGWRGGKVSLLSRRVEDWTLISYLHPGQNVRFYHHAVDGWNYVVVTDKEWNVLGAGWTNVKFTESSCDQWAG